MVAVSLRCLACRRRKIKCDRQVPTCGQCQKSGRTCSGPPPKYKFIQSYAVPPAKGRKPDACQPIVLTKERASLIEASARIAMPIPRTKSTQVAEDLAYRITAEACEGHLYGFGSILQILPSMLDASPALTSAVECCLSTNAILSLVPYHSKQIDPKLYGRALSALQLALQDPDQRFSKTTLSAMAMMHRIEFLVNTTKQPYFLGPSFSVLHTAGVSSILTSIGPFDADDDLLFYILSEHALPIFYQSLTRGEACFLADPEWLSIFLTRRARSSIERTLFDLSMILFSLPGLVLEVRKLGEDMSQSLDVANQANLMSDELLNICRSIETLLDDRSEVETLECECRSSPVRDVYRSGNVDLLNLCIMHAVCSIMVNNILIITLTGVENDDRIRELKRQNMSCSKRIWMLHEQAGNTPLYPTALVMSYQSADTTYTANWIVATMNALQNRNARTKSELWTGKQIWLRCLMAIGVLDFAHYEEHIPLVEDVYLTLEYLKLLPNHDP